MVKSREAAKLMITLCALVLGSGCGLFSSDEEGDEDPMTRSSLVIANGGNFADQNGYLMLYNPETGVRADLPDLGAFAHSLTLKGNRAYVSLNTFSTGRVDVVDLEARQVIQQIDVAAPRSTALSGDDKLLVTNLSVFGLDGPEPGIVSEIQLSTESVQDAASVGLYPEGIAIDGGRAYVANSGNLGDGRTLSVIDLSAGGVAEVSLECDGPNEVFIGRGGEVIVVCEGMVVYNDDFTQIIRQTNGQVVFVDPASFQVIDRLVLDNQPGSANGSQSAYYDDLSGELWVISDATDRVLRIDTDRSVLEATLDVPDQDDLTGLAAVAYDGLSETLYLARLAKGPGGFPDFAAAGAVIVLDRNAVVLDRFTTGPAPTHIAVR